MKPNVKTSIEYHSNGDTKKIERIDESSGVIISDCFYWGGGKLSYTEKRDGRIVEHRFYDRFGRIKKDFRFNGKNDVERIWYENGILERQTEFLNGKMHGIEEKRDELGRLRRSAEYFYGEEVSFKEYGAKNNLLREGFSEKNVFITRAFFENGIQAVDIKKYLEEDKREELTFYENGNKKSMTLYLGNVKNESYCWNPMGEISYSYIEKDCFAKECKYDNNGLLLFEYNYYNGVRHGDMREWYSGGIPKIEEYYEHGRKEGIHMEYEEDGRKEIRKYSGGLLNYLAIYDSNGFPKYDMSDTLGHTLIKTFEKGALSREVLYRDGLKISENLYSDEGIIKRTFDAAGRGQVEKVVMSSNGKIYREILYENGFEWENRTFDDNGELKGVRVYGADISLKYYKSPETIPVEKILEGDNLTTRRAYLKLLGYSLFLQRVPHEILHNEGDYSLVRVRMPAPFNRFGRRSFEPIVLIKVKCPTTGMFYTLRVPPDTRTCKEALAWTFGVNQEKYELEEEA